MGTRKIDIEKLNEEERAIVEARRAYKREWRAKNRDRIAEYNRRFWAKQARENAKNNAE